MDEPEVPDDLWDPMPPLTYCKCAETWVHVDDTAAALFDESVRAQWSVSVRLQCPVCGCWTGSVPPAEK